MFLKPAQEDDEPFECSYAMPIFKQRYNNRQINMPWTYEEYLKNQGTAVPDVGTYRAYY